MIQALSYRSNTGRKEKPMTPVIFINCRRWPFLRLISECRKTYETRTKNTLKSLMEWNLGKPVLLAETGNGEPVIRCSAIIDRITAVYTREAWEKLLPETMVQPGSEYDWTPGTKVKWLYHLTDVHPVEPITLPRSARRHGRVWAEYEGGIEA